MKRGRCGGFTLLEILLVVGIISVLAGIVIIAINPGRQLAQVRNTERRSDIKQIYNAVQQFYIDKKYYPASTTDYVSSLLEICDTSTSTYPSGLSCSGLVDLSQLVPTYITAIPVDPQGPVSGGAGYWLGKTSTGRIVLNSKRAELGAVIAIGTSTATTTTSLIPTNGLVSYWSFNDAGAGTALDLIGGNDGIVNGAIATTSVKGIANRAYYFDGNDYISVVDNANLRLANNFTISIWIYLKSYTGGQSTIMGKSYTNYELMVEPTLGVLKAYIGNGAGGFVTYDTNSVVPLNTWTFVSLSWNGTTISISKNDNTFIFAKTTAMNLGTEALNIGRRNDGTYYLNGAIDEVRIYNRSLSSDEITTIYNEEKP